MQNNYVSCAISRERSGNFHFIEDNVPFKNINIIVDLNCFHSDVT